MKYVIIGGVASGMSAAMEIYRTDTDAQITVLERGEDYSYGQCGLPYVIGGVIPSLDALIARDVDTFKEKYGIDARIHTQVEEIMVDEQIVRGINHHTNTPFEIHYDRLLIATGTSPIFPSWEGSHLKGIYPLKTFSDAQNILKTLQKDMTAVTVVGGGYIGLEMAENLVELGKEVTIIQRGPQLAGIFDPDMATFIHDKANEKGIKLILNEEVTGFSGDSSVEQIHTEEGSYETQFVVLAMGVQANTQFLKNTGIQLTDKGAIRVNAYQETNVENIYAAGDCATHFHRIKHIQDHIPLGTTANKQGRIAGANMVGKSFTFKGIVGTSIIQFFNDTLGKTGINEEEAKKLNIPYHVHTGKGNSRAGYYPGGETLHIKLLSHKETNQLLGAQMIGGEGVDKRIDVLATALYNEMTLQQLVDLDLSYAPPYNGVWDPIQIMARKTFG